MPITGRDAHSLLHSQCPGRRVAGCSLCRRVVLFAAGSVVGLRWWAGASRAFGGFLL